MNKIILYAAVLLVFVGIPVAFIDNTQGSELPLLVGLFIMLAANNTKEDERAVTLKASSTYIALIIGYGMKLLVSNLYSRGVIPVEINEVNYFLIIVFALALVIYHSRLYFLLK